MLLIHFLNDKSDASTIAEHINSFLKYSRFKVMVINTHKKHQIPGNMDDFDAVVLHYSLFGNFPFQIGTEIQTQISLASKPIKIAFFQDEHQFCQERFTLIKRCGISTIYSILKPEYHHQIYGINAGVDDVVQTLTGYVDVDMVERAKQLLVRFDKTIDVSYRGRELKYFMGAGAQEKSQIAKKFLASDLSRRLCCDISVNESDRLYGDEWYFLLAKSRCALTVESGVSVFDVHGEVKPLVRRVFQENPLADFEEVQHKALLPFENKIFYRAISPRIFECAAFQVCLICFEGEYQGVIDAEKHYIPLRKDFLNIRDVVAQIATPKIVSEIAMRAYEHLILSTKYHYEKFISEFDDHVEFNIENQEKENYFAKINNC